MRQKEKSYYQSLYQLVTILNSARSPGDILHSIVEGVAKAMGAKACSLMLLAPHEKVLLHTAAYGLSDWFVRQGLVSADKSMSVTLNGRPVTVLDATTDDRVQYRKQVGVMRVYTSEPRRFTEAGISFATAAANFGAIALEAARFYETLQIDYDTLRQDIRQRRAEVGYEWMTEPPVKPAEEERPIAHPSG